MSRVTKKWMGKCTFQPYEVIITVNKKIADFVWHWFLCIAVLCNLEYNNEKYMSVLLNK